MARTARTTAIDLTTAQELTAGRIERLTCPAGKPQAFLRDTKAPGLRVRVTPPGAKAFIFEAKLHRATLRQTIGDVRAWTIEAARAEANRLRVLIDGGRDPRELQREQEAAAVARKAVEKAHAVTVQEAWDAYIEERRHLWSERYYQDRLRKAKAGVGHINCRFSKRGPVHLTFTSRQRRATRGAEQLSIAICRHGAHWRGGVRLASRARDQEAVCVQW
jgi:hypothetical protein